MFKNVASQKLIVYAFDATTGIPKTGDAANLTAYVSKDFGSVTVLGDTSATEMDATNAKGSYLFDLTQGETNADCAHFTAKSSTANIYIVPQTIYTDPASYTSFVTPTNLTAAQIATSVWQDTTAGDFTTALSVGKSVMNGVSLGTGLTVAAVSGAVGSVTGAVGSVTGAVGSVTGNVGGNVVGTVASVVGAVGSVTGLTASDVGAIKAKTDNLPAAPASTTNITAGTITTATNLTTNNDKTGYALTSAYDPAKTAAQAGNAMALTSGERTSVADALLDRTDAIETGVTMRGLMRLLGSVLVGKLSGAGTTTEVFRNAIADSKARVTATVDGSGNRTAISTDLT